MELMREGCRELMRKGMNALMREGMRVLVKDMRREKRELEILHQPSNL